jgi:hypothetical protein
MRLTFKLMVVLAVLAIGATVANAMPGYLYNFNLTYPYAAATIGKDCTLCHAVPGGGGPPNSYGADYARNGYDFHVIEPLDSDNDGFTNIEEIQALTYPGDPTSHPVNTTFIGIPTSGTLPLTVSFTSALTNSPTAWSWDFGDGSTSTLQNPVHIYTTSGSDPVSLTASVTGGALTIIRDSYISVYLCANPPVRIGTSYSDNSIQNIYNLAINGTTIQIQALDFAESPIFNLPIDVILVGGYDCDFTSILAFATIQGSMTISNGTVTIANLIFQ